MHKERTPGMARPWGEVVEPTVTKRNIKVLYEVAGKRLLRDQKCQIIGITATQGEREIRVKAKRAVILTCGFLYHAIFPTLNVMQFNGAYPWGADELSGNCPDGDNLPTVKLTRVK